ncbi:polysaccharide deacetylase family protein [Pigmentiphaga sp.]|jgi:Predicted xylanase/chitin deacetylase|uniref:polysaccharide deacetylase family protein n=1 Tax=Pigmentiphaga sp. TaxID=1977564 RepID=UPI0025E31955|nr:polysaccharide deacetylase family protein [Pigmentiphaga sp.]
MPRGSRFARVAAFAPLLLAAAAQAADCSRPVYLTFDTGHMGVAPLVAEVLERQQVQATFFLANETTLDGGTSLDDRWAPWWRQLAARGHVFGSHTYDHVYWQADLPEGFRMKPAFGPRAGRTQTVTADGYCAELDRSARRFKEMTGRSMSPLFRAPGGKTSSKLLEAAERRCGYRHVGWTPAGFLGDELPSDKYPNRLLLERALRNIRSGDILLAHLGIWSRQDPWAPAVLEPLIEGLKQKGLCFATLAEHPRYRDWLSTHHVNEHP